MDNSGKITVFLCLIMSSMLLVMLTVNKIIIDLSVKEKSVIAAKSAMSDIKAEYNTYIFEHYHILLFDKTCGGRGEAYLEEKLNENMAENMGGKADVEQTVISAYELIYDDNCQPFKSQVNDYMKYAVVEYGAEKISEQTEGADGTLSETLADDIKQQGDIAEQDYEPEGESVVGEEGTSDSEAGIGEGGTSDSEAQVEPDNIPETAINADDPRDYTVNAARLGIVNIIKPMDMEISGAYINTDNCISKKFKGVLFDSYEINAEFDDCDRMLDDMKSHESWSDKLSSSVFGLNYAVSVFNCAVDTSVNPESVLKYELEYLACGKETDAQNIETAVERIVLLRFPVNYAYLVTDTVKMGRVKQIATPIALLLRVPVSVVKTLIAGCWAYVEAMADVRILMQGDKVPFEKTNSTWITDIDNLGESIYSGSGSENGLSYQHYMMILLSMNMDKTYYRMLDLINVNAKCSDGEFDISNGVTAFTAEFTISYGDKKYYIKEMGGY